MPTVFVFFALSGLAGLIYESIWANYLKLLVGHATYGQVLSMCVFMGGLALGSHLAGRRVDRLRRPWLAYGVVELCIGLGALLYHPLFELASGWLWGSGVLEGRGDLVARGIVAAVGILLTMPLAVLLGATFPLVASGLLRRVPDQGHQGLGGLYFANSLGGALGCLLNSFVLVPRLGLQGGLQFAAVLNFTLAAYFLVLSPRDPGPVSIEAPVPSVPRDKPGMGIVALVAFFTGLSSFLYEIGWIRMLALQLGSSTHSFDIMLAAFLTGLALGGWWIRKRLDRPQPRLRLARMQLAMAACAVASLIRFARLERVDHHGMDALLAKRFDGVDAGCALPTPHKPAEEFALAGRCAGLPVVEGLVDLVPVREDDAFRPGPEVPQIAGGRHEPGYELPGNLDALPIQFRVQFVAMRSGSPELLQSDRKGLEEPAHGARRDVPSRPLDFREPLGERFDRQPLHDVPDRRDVRGCRGMPPGSLAGRIEQSPNRRDQSLDARETRAQGIQPVPKVPVVRLGRTVQFVGIEHQVVVAFRTGPLAPGLKEFLE